MDKRGRKGEKGEKRTARRPPKPLLAPAEVSEVRLGRRNLIWLAIAIGVIILGFVALAMGSMIIAPILLVGGYLAGVPYALMTRGTAHRGASRDRGDVRADSSVG